MADLLRPLSSIELVEQFLIGCLGLDKSIERSELKKIGRAVLTQQCLLVTGKRPTLTHQDNRDSEYRDDNVRERLRTQILEELLTLSRLDNDDEIVLGRGGALPKTEVASDRQAYFVVGLPASGKSSIVNHIADSCKAIVVDSDYAKRKFPEYDGSPGGANLVHKESSMITFGNDSLFIRCLEEGYNMVIPKIGSEIEQLRELRNGVSLHKYKTHVTLVELDRVKATTRAFYRFQKTGRYVPLSLVFDGFANDPIMVYYKHKSEWDSSGAISTLDLSPKMIESSDRTNPASLF